MRNEVKIKVDKIFTKIDKIAKLGRDYQMDYKKYLDELLLKGDYDYFKMCLETHYQIDIRSYNNFLQVKDSTWELILEKTKSAFLEKLKKLYNSKGVYQIGNDIRSESFDNTIIGLSNTLDSTYNEISGTSSKIGFSKSGQILNVDIIDSKLYNININRVTWNSSAPIINSFLENINCGTYNDIMSYTGSLTNTKILDNVNVINSINVNSDFIGINEIDLRFNITHSYVGDLLINLKAPNQKVINVKKENVQGGLSNNYLDVTFTTNDKYKKLTSVNYDNLVGKYQMDKFSGIGTQSYISNAVKISELLPIVGTWSFFIRDIGIKDSGTLNSWFLNFTVIKRNDYFTQSSYPTQIPLTHGGTYLIEVEKKNDYGKFYYRLDLSREDKIGSITEVPIDNYLESNFYYKNKKLAEILGYKRTFLEVRKAGSDDMITIAHIDSSSSEEMNLYKRYEMAIDYLLS